MQIQHTSIVNECYNCVWFFYSAAMNRINVYDTNGYMHSIIFSICKYKSINSQVIPQSSTV